jgi:hypothetical protein
MFLVHAWDDPISDVDNTITMYRAMKRSGVSVEMHLYATGGHGFGVRKVGHPCETWTERCIDRLRGLGAGNWRSLPRPHHCPRKAVSCFRVTFRIRRDPGAVILEPIPLRAPLPKIEVPLRSNDPVVELHLQELLDAAFITGRYSRRLDYQRELTPPLDEGDAARAESILQAAGKK